MIARVAGMILEKRLARSREMHDRFVLRRQHRWCPKCQRDGSLLQEPHMCAADHWFCVHCGLSWDVWPDGKVVVKDNGGKEAARKEDRE